MMSDCVYFTRQKGKSGYAKKVKVIVSPLLLASFTSQHENKTTWVLLSFNASVNVLSIQEGRLLFTCDVLVQDKVLRELLVGREAIDTDEVANRGEWWEFPWDHHLLGRLCRMNGKRSKGRESIWKEREGDCFFVGCAEIDR